MSFQNQLKVLWSLKFLNWGPRPHLSEHHQSMLVLLVRSFFAFLPQRKTIFLGHTCRNLLINSYSAYEHDFSSDKGSRNYKTSGIKFADS